MIVELLQGELKMSEKKVVRHIEPFTNEFGDVIQPGEAVYAVTMCTSRTHITKGEYLGVIKREGRRGQVQLVVQVEVDAKRTAYRYKDTKEDTTWIEYYYNGRPNGREVEIYSVPCKRVSTLQLNRIVPAKISADQL